MATGSISGLHVRPPELLECRDFAPHSHGCRRDCPGWGAWKRAAFGQEPEGGDGHLKSALRQPEQCCVICGPWTHSWCGSGSRMETSAPEGLRGTAVHLSSGREVTFTEPAELVSFLSDAGGPEGELAPAARIDRDGSGSISHV